MAKTFTPTDEVIQIIGRRHELEPVRNLHHLQGGFSSPVVAVDERFVVKLNKGNKPLHLEKLTRESFLYSLLTDLGFPVPRLIAFDTSKEAVPYFYMVIDYVRGGDLVANYPHYDEETKRRVAHNIGFCLRQIHSLPLSTLQGNIGYFTRDEDWKDSFLSNFQTAFDEFQSLNLVQDPQHLIQIQENVIQFQDRIHFQERDFVLLHHDFNGKHVITNDGNVSALIDFEWACLGDPIWDFQKLLSGFSAGTDFPIADFFRGYGIAELNEDEKLRLRMYTLNQGIWQVVNTFKGEHGYPQEVMDEGYVLIDKALKYL
jgi:aminoglycoside phosphotransferase (APT) family kinase protein